MTKSAHLKQKKFDKGNKGGKKPFGDRKTGNKPMRGKKPMSNQGKDGEAVKRGKKIQKSNKTSDLQSHYQRIVLNIKKKATNLENLNKAITDFITYYKENTAMVPKKIFGAKALQLCLKYGTESHKETIVLLLLRDDFVTLCKSTYGGFIINKIFVYSEGIKSLKVVKAFFRDNFASMVSIKENLMALSSYVNSMDEKVALNYLNKVLPGVVFDEGFLQGILEYAQTKPSIMKHSLIYYLAYYLFDTLDDDQRIEFLGLILKNLDEVLIKNNHKYFLVLCLIKFFLNVNFKNKKEIIKKMLKEKFLEYYLKHSSFLYLLIALLTNINDQKIINITILKAFKTQLQAFFENVSIAKLMDCLFSNEIHIKLQKDRFFKCNQNIKELLNIEELSQNELFLSNVNHIGNEIASEGELLSYLNYDNLTERVSENSTFSLLFSSILERMLRSKLNRPKPCPRSRYLYPRGIRKSCRRTRRI